MKKTLIIVLACLSFFAFHWACVIAVVNYSGAPDAYPVEKFHKIIALDSGGTLSLENIDGDVEIYGWERNEIEVTAEKFLSFPKEKNIRVLPWKDYAPKIKVDRFEDYVKIKTIPGTQDKGASRVNYFLKVPQSINLKDIRTGRGNTVIADLYGKVSVDTREGDIHVENFSGSLIASVEAGSVKATLFDLRDGDEITVTSKQGDIEINLHPEVRAEIVASAQDGEVTSEFDLGISLPSKQISAQIGKGGAFLSLKAGKGNIFIRKIKEVALEMD